MSTVRRFVKYVTRITYVFPIDVDEDEKYIDILDEELYELRDGQVSLRQMAYEGDVEVSVMVMDGEYRVACGQTVELKPQSSMFS